MPAARWSNACTIFPSYSGNQGPPTLSNRLPPIDQAPSCSSNSSRVRNRSESLVISNIRTYFTGQALTSSPEDRSTSTGRRR